MPTLVIRGPDGTLVERELDSRLTVGCDDDNDLVLRSNGVEKRHANFFADGGEVVLEQLDGGSSSAQTIVDGAPMRGRRRLAPGVRVVIGEYEVQLKPSQVTVRKVEPAPALLEGPSSRPPTAFPFRLVFALFGIALAVIIAAGIYRRLSMPEPPTPPIHPTDPCADLEPYLRIARGEANEKALQAVKRVLDCDPINAEAMALERSIPKALDAKERLARANEFIGVGRDEQALEQLEKIDPVRLAQPLLSEVSARVAKEAKTDCDSLKKAGKKALAQPRCELYERLKKGLDEAKKPPLPEGPTLAERVLDRVHEPELAEPVLLYAAGKNADAKLKLQHLVERSSMAALQPAATAMLKDINDAEGLYKVGEGALDKLELERATKAFKDALTYDAKVLPEGGSALSRKIDRLTAEKALELGTVHAQRKNWVRACEAWKIGFAFYKGNTDLNQAVASECTRRAAELADSPHCKDLDLALKLAVPGDDLEPKISESRERLSCK